MHTLSLSLSALSLVLSSACLFYVVRIGIELGIIKRMSHTINYVPVDKQGMSEKQLHEQFLKSMESMLD